MTENPTRAAVLRAQAALYRASKRLHSDAPAARKSRGRDRWRIVASKLPALANHFRTGGALAIGGGL